MITVIIGLELGYCFFKCPIFVIRQLFYFGFEVVLKLFFRNAANGCVLWLKTDVAQIVEHGEEGYLGKLGNARDEHKLLIFVICLQDGEDVPVDCGAFFVMRRFPGMLQGRIVFIHKDGHLLSGLLEG